MANRGRRNRRSQRGGDGSAAPTEASRSGATPRRARRQSPRRRGQQKNNSQLLIYGAAAALVILVVVVVLQVLGGAGSATDFGFSVYQGQERLGGDEVNFSEVLSAGQPVVLNFWAGDCPPCRAEMPALQAVYEAHEDELTFVGLDVGVFTGLGNRDNALALLEELNITYPAGAPPNRTPVTNFSVVSMPTTVFFDAGGSVFRQWNGAINEQQMNGIVEDMLAQGAS